MTSKNISLNFNILKSKIQNINLHNYIIPRIMQVHDTHFKINQKSLYAFMFYYIMFIFMFICIDQN